jgi:hypothetical protein
MPSIVSKVKDAIRGDSDTTHDSNSGQHGRTSHERDTYGQDSSRTGDHHGITTSRDTGADQGRFMGAGQMNPRSGTSDNTGSSALPGSFPGGQDNTTTRHRDGREYIAPKGTAVGHDQTGETGYDRAEQAVTGRDTSGNYNQTSSSRGNVRDERLMDPASHDAGSNVMGSAAAGDGHSKLHKRDDPRVDSDRDGSRTAGEYGTTTTTSTTSTTTGPHSSKLANKLDPRVDSARDSRQTTSGSGQPLSGYPGGYGTATSGQHGTHRETVGGDSYEQQSGRGYAADQQGGHGGRGLSTAAGAAGAGGLAAHELSSRHGDKRQQEYPASTGESHQQGYPTGAGSHLAQSTQGQRYDDQSRGTGVYNTVTGHGSGREYDQGGHGVGKSTGQGYSSAPGVSSGSCAVPREAGDSRSGGHSSMLGAGAAAGGAAGAAGMAGHHGSDRERYDQGTESGYGTSRQHDPASAGYGNTGAPSAMTGGQGQYGQSSTQPGSGHVPGGGDHFGPGHPGSKVMHTCNHCGKDNDISHYFKKDVVYRIHQ